MLLHEKSVKNEIDKGNFVLSGKALSPKIVDLAMLLKELFNNFKAVN